MIRTVAELLEKLMEKERETLPEYDDIQHPGLFGEMYEGLAKALVGKALFEGMDLRVVWRICCMPMLMQLQREGMQPQDETPDSDTSGSQVTEQTQ